MNISTYVREKILCKECLVIFRRLLKDGFISTFTTDTKSAEIISSLVLISVGIALIFPIHFSTGELFSIVLYNTVLQVIPNIIWGFLYLIIGTLNGIATLFGSLQFRRYIAIICVYLWLCLIFYLHSYSDSAIDLTIIPYIWLGVTSVLTYLALWRR